MPYRIRKLADDIAAERTDAAQRAGWHRVVVDGARVSLSRPWSDGGRRVMVDGRIAGVIFRRAVYLHRARDGRDVRPRGSLADALRQIVACERAA